MNFKWLATDSTTSVVVRRRLARPILAGVATLCTAGLSSANEAPVVSAGKSKVVEAIGQTIVLDGTATDPDGTIVGREWTQESGATLATSGSSTEQLTLFDVGEGAYRFRFTATDNQEKSSSALAYVIVKTGSDQGQVSGELKRFHCVETSFTGPFTSENESPNPFTDYRLDVVFIQPDSGAAVAVPGFYAADGNAAESGASSGDEWHARLAPMEVGEWHYYASFRTGANVAAELDWDAGSPSDFDGAHGSFEVAASDKSAPDFRSQGILQYVNDTYLRFSGTGDYFLKGGADSPENLLAYADFDNTVATHYYNDHAGDYTAGGPTWKGGKGKNLLGALSYLAGEGMNSVYFLTMNVNGDGDDVWPWIEADQRIRYDVSKLEQWERVFAHMDSVGLMQHFVTQETENDQLLDGGALGTERKVYYRELIARFGHHPAVTWNLGEENTNSTSQLREFFDYVDELDGYDHVIVVHTYPGDKDEVYDPLLDSASLCGASLQMSSVSYTHSETLYWLEQSVSHGQPWVVCLDEIGPAGDGVLPDSKDADHDEPRRHGLWGNLMAGGGGVEWYFGYNHEHDDLDCEDWRSREEMWALTDIALSFFFDYVPFWDMQCDDSLISGSNNMCFAKPGVVYVAYLPDGGQADLEVEAGNYQIRWFDPRDGGSLIDGATASGPGSISLGSPPNNSGKDWAVLVEQSNSPPVIANFSFSPNPLVQPADLAVNITVDDADGIDDIHRLLILIVNPAGQFMGAIQPAVPANGVIDLSISNVDGLEVGLWHYAVFVEDKQGASVVTELEPLLLR